MRKIKIAIVGTGFMGKVHAENVRRVGNVEIAAGVSATGDYNVVLILPSSLTQVSGPGTVHISRGGMNATGQNFAVDFNCKGAAGLGFLFVAFNMQGPHQGLGSFVDFDFDGQSVFLPLVVVVNGGGDLHLLKAVAAVNILKSADIVVQQVLVKSSPGKKTAGGLHTHSGKKKVAGKICVAGDLNLHQLVARAFIDHVDDAEFVVLRIVVSPECYPGIEIALRLQVVQQVTTAFVQQVVIECIFLEDGNRLPQLAPADPGALDNDVHRRTRLYVERVIDSMLLRFTGKVSLGDVEGVLASRQTIKRSTELNLGPYKIAFNAGRRGQLHHLAVAGLSPSLVYGGMAFGADRGAVP